MEGDPGRDDRETHPAVTLHRDHVLLGVAAPDAILVAAGGNRQTARGVILLPHSGDLRRQGMRDPVWRLPCTILYKPVAE